MKFVLPVGHRRRLFFVLTLLVSGWGGMACAAGHRTAVATVASGAASKSELIAMASPSRLIPDFEVGRVSPWGSALGENRFLIGGLRVVERSDGRLERANERFPAGGISAMSLPDRLGGGFLYYQSDTQGIRLWRADTWVAPLRPLAALGVRIVEVMAGFDRLILRTHNNGLLALDAETGDRMPLDQLPLASAYGPISFADGWRAVVVADLLGPMASFDGGGSWRSLAIDEPLSGAGVTGGDPVLYTTKGYYRLDIRGRLQHVASFDDAIVASNSSVRAQLLAHHAGDQEIRQKRRREVFRAAVARGWPDSKTTAMVVHRGSLYRIRLPDGHVVAMRPEAIADEGASCQGVRVGSGFGFVCGIERGPTTVYRFEPPMNLRLWARFESPRFVASSGNGALVVRGSCGPAVSSNSEVRNYCIIDTSGEKREVGVRGDLGTERVVALDDGRVVVLVPPRLLAKKSAAPDKQIVVPGQLTVITDEGMKTVKLQLPEEPKPALAVAQRGLWMQGFEQRGPDQIAGWVEAGGPAVGITVELDGKVALGEPYMHDGQLLISGRFALGINETEGAVESTDGGQTWRSVELPQLSVSGARDRACTPVGCVLRSWIRAGWGRTVVPDDLGSCERPSSPRLPFRSPETLRLSCDLQSRSKEQPSRASRGSIGRGTTRQWQGLASRPPPHLEKGFIGLSHGTERYDQNRARVFVWGPEGADWLRTGWWSVFFEDRFSRGVRGSARTRSLWPDDRSAAVGIGTGRAGSRRRWRSHVDPGGYSALLDSCRGMRCDRYAIADGQPIVPLNSPTGVGMRAPIPRGVAKLGRTWYWLTSTKGAIALWRAEGQTVRRLAQYWRPPQVRNQSKGRPQLVRRAVGEGLGLLLTIPADRASSGPAVSRWVVVPIDTSTGQLGESIELGRADLAGQLLPRCTDSDEGWLVNTSLSSMPAIQMNEVSGAFDSLFDVVFKMRLRTTGSCIEGMAAKTRNALGVSRSSGGRTRVAPRGDRATNSIPLRVRKKYRSEFWSFACRER